MGNSNGRDSRAFRALAKRLRAELPPVCSICFRPIDVTLHHMDAWSWTLDHVRPLAEWPEGLLVESNLKPAHRRCNILKGAGGMPTVVRPKQSRRWLEPEA